MKMIPTGACCIAVVRGRSDVKVPVVWWFEVLMYVQDTIIARVTSILDERFQCGCTGTTKVMRISISDSS